MKTQPHSYVRQVRRLRQCAGVRAFTLVETLIVVAIVGALTALLLPMLKNALLTARITQSLTNLRQVGVASDVYADDNDGVYPFVFNSTNSDSFIATVWPYVYKNRFPGTEPIELKGSIYYTPLVEDPVNSRTFGQNAVLELTYASRRYKRVVSNQSQVAFIGDVINSGNFRPNQINYRNRGMANVLFLDGHVQSVSSNSVPASYPSIFWSGSL